MIIIKPMLQSLEIGKQAFEAFGVRFAEEERPHDGGYGEGNSGVGASDAAPQEEPRVFANAHPEDLAAELETAEILGIRPMHVDDAGFGQLASVGPIKWVITQGGELLVASSVVAHTVLTNGEAVIAAGEAEVEVNGHKRGLAINTKSDHYQADEHSLEIRRRAFEAFGITFSLAGSGDGHGGVAAAVQPETSEHAHLLSQQASTSGTSHLGMEQLSEWLSKMGADSGDNNAKHLLKLLQDNSRKSWGISEIPRKCLDEFSSTSGTNYVDIASWDTSGNQQQWSEECQRHGWYYLHGHRILWYEWEPTAMVGVQHHKRHKILRSDSCISAEK